MEYDFGSLETRRMYLAGTVPFPTPFPTVGNITFRESKFSLECHDQGVAKPTVVVDEPVRFDNKVIRTVFQQDVTALFVPEITHDDDTLDLRGKQCLDFERGQWFLGDEVESDTLRRQLHIGEGQPFKGILFVMADAPVFARIDLTLSAAESCLVDLPIQGAGCLPCRRR